jgi:5-methyltetrahydropteroyltriglutamate--homocysteine methyltransferase
MQRSRERFLTTHTGSLPRPADLLPLLFAREDGAGDQAALDAAIQRAVADVVRKQAEVGVDVLNDGEMGKITYATYVKDRLTGFDGESTMIAPGDMLDYPEFGQRGFRGSEESMKHMRMPACTGPIAVRDSQQVQRDIANLKAATNGANAADIFLSAASPGVIALFFQNHYYPAAKPTWPRLPQPCSPNMKQLQRRASYCRSTARISPWDATSSSMMPVSTSSALRPA